MTKDWINQTYQNIKAYNSIISVGIEENNYIPQPPTTETLTCIECLNVSINCSLSYAENSTGYWLHQKYCGGDDEMYTGLAIMLFTTMAIYGAIFWFVNNLRARFEMFSTLDSAKKNMSRIRNDMIVRFIGVFILVILNLSVVGFLYYTAQKIDPQLAKMAFVYFILSMVGVIALSFIAFFKMFMIPFNKIGEMLDAAKQTRNIR